MCVDFQNNKYFGPIYSTSYKRNFRTEISFLLMGCNWFVLITKQTTQVTLLVGIQSQQFMWKEMGRKTAKKRNKNKQNKIERTNEVNSFTPQMKIGSQSLYLVHRTATGKLKWQMWFQSEKESTIRWYDCVFVQRLKRRAEKEEEKRNNKTHTQTAITYVDIEHTVNGLRSWNTISNARQNLEMNAFHAICFEFVWMFSWFHFFLWDLTLMKRSTTLFSN